MKKDKKLLVLLDAHAIIHRAYHALPDFISSKGEPTGALYGIVSMLLKIIKDLNPDYIVACYDLPGPTFRHVAYDNYKKGRSEADDSLIAQIIRSKDIFRAFNIPMYEAPGFEADDLLGTITEQLKNKDINIIIASGDMDTMQLVDGKKVRVYTLKKGINDTIIYDEDGVNERFGFAPKLLPDFKGLRGDPSDNIIGIAGIGEKTATTLIKSFGTIENIYKVLKKDKKKISEAGMSERIIKLLEEGEEEALFSKTLAQIRRDAPIKFSVPSDVWIEGASAEKINTLLRELDFKSLGSRINELFGIKTEKEAEVKEEKVVESFKKEDLEKAAIALFLIDSEKTNPDLDDILAFTRKKTLAESIPVLQKELENRDLVDVYEKIELPIIPILKKAEERGILVDKDYFKKLSTDYHKSLAELEKKIWLYAGEEFNINSPKQLGDILFDKMALAADKGVKMKKTEGGARSTKISELEKLRDIHPIISDIVDYRELQKLLSTYIDAIPPMVDSSDRLHSHFIQTGAATGRFSSTNPNLQNIPIRSELGKKIRNGFVADKGYKLISLDYSQIELRVAAILSGDKYLVNIFKEGKDVHSAVAAKVFNVDEKDVTSDMRRKAKVINFGIIYGMGVTALKDNLKSTRAEAQEFYDKYLAELSGLSSYLEEVKTKTKKDGYTETLFGRKRYFPGIKSKIPFIRAMAERMAINAPIQGTATADVIKIAIKKAEDALGDAKILNNTHLLLQIHDELVYEVKEEKVNEAIEIIREAMEGVLNDKKKNPEGVPLLVGVSVGNNMGELK